MSDSTPKYDRVPERAEGQEEETKTKSKKRSLEKQKQDGSNNNHNEKKKKRSRSSNHKINKRNKSDGGDEPSTNTQKILNGMIIAVSTLQEQQEEADQKKTAKTGQTSLLKENDDTSLLSSYRVATEACRTAGATISSQVHKKVHCVLCTSTAVQQATQRVRKAQKRQIPLVDLKWLQQSIKQNQRLPLDSFRLERYLEQHSSDNPNSNNAKDNKTRQPPQQDDDDDNDTADMKKKEKKKTKKHKKKKGDKDRGKRDVDGDLNDNDNVSVSDEDDTRAVDPNAGWSSPVAVGCCCVCHENGDTNCPWCTDCKGV